MAYGHGLAPRRVLIVADKEKSFILSGNGNVIEPEDSVATIGSGGAYARAAALAFLKASPKMTAKDIVTESLGIASGICIYTNSKIAVEEL
jgi:ATP-dependent HslUV protease subunit HslV